MVIWHKVLAEIEAHAVREFPAECCGVLLGRRISTEGGQREVLRAQPCRNASPRPETSYLIAPAELIAAQREARELGLAIVGFYHSHPRRSAVPSVEDLAQAEWDHCSYVIISVSEAAGRPRVEETRAFALLLSPDRHWEEEPIQMDD